MITVSPVMEHTLQNNGHTFTLRAKNIVKEQERNTSVNLMALLRPTN